jgi:hypothetical protein
MYDAEGNEVQLLNYESVNQLIGKTITIKFQIHGAKGIPDLYCNEVYCDYKWIDESA